MCGVNELTTGMARVSRESLVQSLDNLDSACRDITLDVVGQLYSFVNIADGSNALLRALTDSAREGNQRALLIPTLFQDKISVATLKTLKGMVGLKWSVPEDLLTAVEIVAANAAFCVAEQAGVQDGSSELSGLEGVERNILRFRRLLAENSQLGQAFSDYRASAEAKRRLVLRLLPGVDEVTKVLLTQAAAYSRGARIMQMVDRLISLLSVRQKHWIAEVRTSVALDAGQHERLRDSLSASYGRRIKLDIAIDESLIGGFKVRVGDEIFDGSVVGRMGQLQRQLEKTV